MLPPAERPRPGHLPATRRRQPCQPELRRHGKGPQPKARCQQPRQHSPGFGPAAAQLLGHEAGSRHRDARRGQRNEQGVHRQHQLVQAHSLTAQGIGQINAQPHACQPEQDIRPGHQGCILQVALPHGAPPFPANAQTGRFCLLYAAKQPVYALCKR